MRETLDAFDCWQKFLVKNSILHKVTSCLTAKIPKIDENLVVFQKRKIIQMIILRRMFSKTSQPIMLFYVIERKCHWKEMINPTKYSLSCWNRIWLFLLEFINVFSVDEKSRTIRSVRGSAFCQLWVKKKRFKYLSNVNTIHRILKSWNLKGTKAVIS